MQCDNRPALSVLNNIDELLFIITGLEVVSFQNCLKYIDSMDITKDSDSYHFPRENILRRNVFIRSQDACSHSKCHMP